jgi:hypothetical protein
MVRSRTLGESRKCWPDLSMAQRTHRGEGERYFPAPGEGREAEIHGGERHGHARSPVRYWDCLGRNSGNGRQPGKASRFRSVLSYEPMHDPNSCQARTRSRSGCAALVNGDATDNRRRLSRCCLNERQLPHRDRRSKIDPFRTIVIAAAKVGSRAGSGIRPGSHNAGRRQTACSR